MPAIELTESVSGAPTTLALRKNSADSPSLLERGGVRSTLVAGIVLLPTCVAMVFIDT